MAFSKKLMGDDFLGGLPPTIDTEAAKIEQTFDIGPLVSVACYTDAIRRS